MERRLKELEDNLTRRLESENRNTNERFEEINGRIIQLQNENTAQNERILQLQNENSAQNGRIIQLENENSTLKNDLTGLKNEKKELQQRLQKAEEIIEKIKKENEEKSEKAIRNNGTFDEKKKFNETGKEDYIGKGMPDVNEGMLDVNEQYNENGKGMTNDKGMLDENQKSNEISNETYNSKEMLDENEKSNERREGGYNGNGMNVQKKFKKKEGETTASAEKGNYLEEKKSEDNTKQFLGKKRNNEKVDENHYY